MNRRIINFKGYIEVSRNIFVDIERTRDNVVNHSTATKDKPDWIKDLPEGEGVPCYEYRGYIILQGRA